ncbi:hypothetical protein BFW01_g1108 [Lasiodiplodia theobromae]|uniref:Uncharacterized protein n=1 Tax=Lasiodiplodia theobromae TaxID=45133 RepID=A0A8H7MCX7_9PEZI|nr:hypothetical protein BFW01_g1108 [Lasiodiplodia theobromae]
MRSASLGSRRALPFLLLLDVILAAQSGDGHVPLCYYPDGTIATNDYACRLDTTESFCCTTNVSCLDNKICDVLSPTQYRYNRGTCTDKTWTSDACPQFCQGEEPGSRLLTSRELTAPIAKSPDYGCGIIRCPDAGGKVCCDIDNKDSTATCCQDDSNLFDLVGDWDAFRVIDKSAASSTRSLVGSSSISTAVTSPGSAASTTSAQSDGEGGTGLQAGAIAGIAVGSVAGASGLGALALWAMRRKRQQKNSSATVELDGISMRHELKAEGARYELGGRQAPQELSSGDERHEMEGSSPLDLNVMKGQEQGKD